VIFYPSSAASSPSGDFLCPGAARVEVPRIEPILRVDDCLSRVRRRVGTVLSQEDSDPSAHIVGIEFGISDVEPQPGGVADVDPPWAGKRPIEVDQAARGARLEDEIAGAQVAMADYLLAGRKVGGRRSIVITPDDSRCCTHLAIRKAAEVRRDLTVDVGENLAPFGVHAEESWSVRKGHRLEMAKQSMDVRSIWATGAMNRVSDSHDSPGDPTSA